MDEKLVAAAEVLRGMVDAGWTVTVSQGVGLPGDKGAYVVTTPDAAGDAEIEGTGVSLAEAICSLADELAEWYGSDEAQG